MRKEDTKWFNVGGILFCLAALVYVLYPRWIAAIGMIWIIILTVVPLGIWTGFKDKSLPMLRRVIFVCLSSAYVVGAAIVSARIVVKAQEQGWFASFR